MSLIRDVYTQLRWMYDSRAEDDDSTEAAVEESTENE